MEEEAGSSVRRMVDPDPGYYSPNVSWDCMFSPPQCIQRLRVQEVGQETAPTCLVHFAPLSRCLFGSSGLRFASGRRNPGIARGVHPLRGLPGASWSPRGLLPGLRQGLQDLML
ncbi:unnamed protein product [Effrenium voratum]|nr:unnamed protein product [Effrenium voratum]